MYVTLKLDDGGCRIHSISDGSAGPGTPLGPHGSEEIVTNERYVVMPWKMVIRHGTNMTLKEAVDRILNQGGSKNGQRTLKPFWEDRYALEISRFVCNKV